jgi:hypothetical protein
LCGRPWCSNTVHHTDPLEVLVKEEHDFYREKWKKEENKRSGAISHVIRYGKL